MRHIYKISAALFLGFILNFNAFSQQIPENNFYNINPFVFNSAAAGINGNVSAYFNYRDQWSGFKNAPESMQFGIHGLLSDAMGLGLNVSQLKHGVLTEFSANINYSYRIKLSREETLAFGASVGFAQNSIDMASVNIEDPTDQTLISATLNEALFNAGLGLHYNWRDLNIHFSIPLVYNTLDPKLFKTIFAFASYDFELSREFVLQPSVLYRYMDGDFIDLDFNMMLKWNNQFWIQTGYRTNESFAVAAGLKYNNIGFAYTYEILTSPLSTAASATHEITLFFDSPFSLTKKKPLFKM